MWFKLPSLHLQGLTPPWHPLIKCDSLVSWAMNCRLLHSHCGYKWHMSWNFLWGKNKARACHEAVLEVWDVRVSTCVSSHIYLKSFGQTCVQECRVSHYLNIACIFSFSSFSKAFTCKPNTWSGKRNNHEKLNW